jgi:hypothetical protein
VDFSPRYCREAASILTDAGGGSQTASMRRSRHIPARDWPVDLSGKRRLAGLILQRFFGRGIGHIERKLRVEFDILGRRTLGFLNPVKKRA